MGKRSRRKKPAPRGGGAVHSNLPPATVADSDFPPGSQFVLNRFRQPTDEFYRLTSDEYGSCLRVSYDVAKLITDRDSSDYAKELWDGVGSMPLQLFDLCAEGKWDDPAVLPSARARERLQEWIQEKIAVTREFYK